ncbi:MAG: tRNA lysidine(34) synthetase TilS [Planctomycetota bacterium]|jgi:tRNA(Ile)-lysidine synthase
MKASEFERRIADFMRDNELLNSSAKVLLAVSGGADSTALLYAMHALQGRGIVDARLECAHINHGLRGEQGDEDERFVVRRAEKLGLKVKVRRVDVRSYAQQAGLSIETAGRELRIESLLDIAAETGCSLVATAHQMDDNAETVVQRLARGTGIRGLAGIWPVREFGSGDIRFVRPMLGVKREEVIEYLKEQNLQWREDETNAQFKFRRNYIRHRLLPALQTDCTGPLAEQLFDLSRAARGYYDLVCRRADETQAASAVFEEGRVILHCEKLLAEPRPVQVELVRRALDILGSGQRQIMQEHYERIIDLAGRDKGGGKVELPGTFAARREYGNVILEKAEPERKTVPQEGIEVTVPGQTPFGPYVVETKIIDIEDCRTDMRFSKHDKRQEVFFERFDLNNIKPPVIVRPRRDGDRFIPLGLQAEKKVGKFLTDARTPGDLRRKVLVVEDSEKVIWLWPIRMSEQAKITDRTRKILQIEITSTPKPDEGKETER